MTAPLAGVVVVSLEHAVAAPLATRHLADLGATVLKVERPGTGDFARSYDTTVAGQSTYFVWANRGKQSIVLDITDPVDRATFDALVAGADVFVENLSRAAAERAGVLAHQVTAQHPHLVACDITGYGLDGPRRDDKAYDLAIQAEAGAMALTGTPDEVAKIGVSVADISTAMYALSSIIAALYRRNVTGEGAAISLSMLECLTEWTAPAVYAAGHSGVVPERVGHRHALIAPYGLYALADGSSVLVAVQSHRDWHLFATTVLRDAGLVTDERFATNAGRIANVDALEHVIGTTFATGSPAEIIDRLVAGRIAWARVRDPLEVWQHEQLAARDRLRPVDVPTGRARMFRPPFDISGMPEPPARVPALGEHDPDLVERITGARRHDG